MTQALWMVLIAGAMPYLFVVMAKNRIKEYDNNKPRVYCENLPEDDWRKRMYWAHQNSFEIFPLFAAAIIIGQMVGKDQAMLDQYALYFIITRFVYGALYAVDMAALRTITWFLGVLCIVRIFL